MKQNLNGLLKQQPIQKISREVLLQDAKRFTKNTLTVEVFSSLYLSDFYFETNEHTNICFDMKSSLDPKKFKDGTPSYDQLAQWINPDTAIDCYISDELKEIRFQIKRYPEPYRSIHTDDLKTFILVTAKKYGDMTDTILVIILQPEKPYEYQDVDWYALAKYFAFSKKHFKEIVFLLNVVGKDLSLCTVYPGYDFKSLSGK